MIPVLKVKDENGNVIAIPAIRGPQGPAGEVDYSRIEDHNTAEDSHNDIRGLIPKTAADIGALGLTGGEMSGAELSIYNSLVDVFETELVIASITMLSDNSYISLYESLVEVDPSTVVKIEAIENFEGDLITLPAATEAQDGCALIVKDGKWKVVSLTASEVGADPAGTASTAVANHNSAADAHSALFAKKANDYSIELYNGNGGVNPVKFMSVNYSTCNSENGVAIKVGMVCGHGNGSSYAFLQEAIFKVSNTGTVSVDNFKYYGAAATYDGSRQYGDIFWVIDTTNKIVDFYCVMGQYSRLNMIPYKRVTYSSGGVITQHTTATVYSSGTKVWGNNSEIATMSDVPTTTENWTFTLEDGSTVTKAVYVK